MPAEKDLSGTGFHQYRWWFPIKHSLGFEYDYQFMINEIVRNIKSACKKVKVPMPNIFTEFGSFTVGESMAHIYSVIGEKMQNDREIWYMMIDTSSFCYRLINGMRNTSVWYITCDTDSKVNELFLPKVTNGEPLYVGFFHTGAYQTKSINGKHVRNDKKWKAGRLVVCERADCKKESMLKILGYIK